MPCFLGRKLVESELKKKDKLLEESEKTAKRLEEEYEYIGLRLPFQGDSLMKRSGMLDSHSGVKIKVETLLFLAVNVSFRAHSKK